MAWIKAYDWEHKKFPIQLKINIQPEYRIPLTKKLLAHYGITHTNVELSKRNGGDASGTYEIRLPRPELKCSLALILHEIAHVLNHKAGGHGHTGKFKHFVIKVYIEYKSEIKRIFAEIREEKRVEKEEYDKLVARAIKKSENRAKQQQLKETNRYKIDMARERIKRLESKQRRISNALKKTNRLLIRLQKKEVSKSMEVIVQQ